MAYTSLEVLPLRSASGPVLGTGDQVRVYYEGRLTDGTLFDRNYDFATFTPVAGRTPFSFTLGAGQVIQGWEQGVAGLSLGDIAELRIPSALGYGPAGSPPKIPANADLNFKVMVVGRVQAGLNPADPANLELASPTDLDPSTPTAEDIPLSTDPAVQLDPLIDGGLVDSPDLTAERTASRVREGDPLVNRIQTDLAPRTTVFWQIEGAGVRADDFDRGDLSGRIRVDQKGFVTLRHQLAMNGPANENESFRIRFFSDGALSQPLGSTGLFAIRDAEPAFYP